MRVTALYYSPPGRGESIGQHFDMHDAAMPTSTAEFAARSVKALAHFWPNVRPTPALIVDECAGRTVIHGQHWSVEWATDAHIADMVGFVERHYSSTNTLGEMLKAAASLQPTRSITL